MNIKQQKVYGIKQIKLVHKNNVVKIYLLRSYAMPDKVAPCRILFNRSITIRRLKRKIYSMLAIFIFFGLEKYEFQLISW